MVAARNDEPRGASPTPPIGEPELRPSRRRPGHGERPTPVTSFRRRATNWIAACVVAIALGSLAGSLLSTVPTLQTLSPAQFLRRAGQIAAFEVVIAVLCTVVVLLVRRRLRATEAINDLAPYGLLPVSEVNPADYVPLYHRDLYQRRLGKASGGIEAAAQRALSLAVSASGLNLPHLPLGICVFGPRMQGKTRLAWDTVRKELPDWTFLAWPHRFNHQWQLVDRCGTQVVIWLDELQTYTAPWEIAALEELLARLRAKGVRFVIVATCRGPGAQDADEIAGPDGNDYNATSPANTAANGLPLASAGGLPAPTPTTLADATKLQSGSGDTGSSAMASDVAEDSIDGTFGNSGDELAEDDELTVRVALGPLVDQLAPIRLPPLSRSEEEHLRKAFKEKFGKDVVMTSPGRCPGAIVLDIDGMRRIYSGEDTANNGPFPPEGQYVLRGLKLLRSAGIYRYPARRVRFAAIQFDLPEDENSWNKGRDEAKLKRFVRVKPETTPRSRWNVFAWFGASGRRERDEVVEPMSVVYLESVVRDREVDLVRLYQAWPTLRTRLTAELDAEGLIYLGQMLLTEPTGDARKNQREAALCFEGALQGRIDDQALAYVPDARVAALCGKGDALFAGAELEVEGAMAEAFLKAANAYGEAVGEARAREAATTTQRRPVPQRMLAYAYRGKGRAHIGRATALETAAPGAKRGATHPSAAGVHDSLRQAIEAYREARKLYERHQEIDAALDLATVLIELASAQVEAAEWEAEYAGATDPAASHLRDAIENYERALRLQTHQSSPLVWAMLQERLADAECEFAKHVEYSQTVHRYERAERAYRAAETVYTPQIAPLDWARLQERLGMTLYDHAKAIQDGHNTPASTGSKGSAVARTAGEADKSLEKQVKLLLEAAEADESALRYVHEGEMPLHWAALNFQLARIYFRLGEIRRAQQRTSDARELLGKAKLHNDRAWTMDQFERVDDARRLRREISLVLRVLE